MLSDYIEQYAAAQKSGDKREMSRIERDLRRLGMDVMTLKVLAREVMK